MNALQNVAVFACFFWFSDQVISKVDFEQFACEFEAVQSHTHANPLRRFFYFQGEA